MGTNVFRVGDEVAAAIEARAPIVAMESTIYSAFGLPQPANREALDRCEEAIRAAGAVPAMTAVIDGVGVVGVAPGRETERVLAATTKIAARDLGHAHATGLDVGVTTVSASVTLAARAGVSVFTTGGIGGVHRDAAQTGDISHDLLAIARHRVVTVSAGAKAFLDLGRTLEEFETLGVPVVGWNTDRFPAFYTRDSGHRVTMTVRSGAEVAALLVANGELGHPGGVLIANPIPEADELDAGRIDAAIADALATAERTGVRGPGVTPAVLAAIASATEGDSVPANLALAENNAQVAAEIALAVSAA